MEPYKSIDEYISSEMEGKIKKQANSPLPGIALLVLGIGLLLSLPRVGGNDNVQALLLTLGILMAAVGLVLTVMCFTRALWHYSYVPTGSSMKSHRVYLNGTHYALLLEALRSGDLKALAGIEPVNSSNLAVRIVDSSDGEVALLQAGNCASGPFVPESPVVVLSREDRKIIDSLCK